MLLVKNLKLANQKTVSLELKNQTSYLLRGENGMGKSLLLKSLSFLLPTTFETFQYKDKNITELRPEYYRSKVMYVGNQIFSVINETTNDFMKYPFTLSIYKNQKPQIDINHWLKHLNLENQKISKLSNGQKQILNFLRVLSLDAEILFLDESFSNLDTAKTTIAIRLLEEWQARTQGSFVIVTHHESQLQSLKLSELEFSKILIARG